MASFIEAFASKVRNRGIGTKLALSILTSIAVIFCFVLTYNYVISRQIISRNIENSAKNLASATVNRINSMLYAFEKVPESLAHFLESSLHGKNDILNLIRSAIINNPEIYGSTVAFEPHAFSKEDLRFAPYFYRRAGDIKFTFLPYNYFYWDWYQIPKELGYPIWTEPYYDEGAGEIVMATYSVPFYRNIHGKREFMGVVTADISLSWLQEMVASIKIAETGYGFLISKNGTFVTHPHSDLTMNETIFSVAEARSNPSIRELGRDMIRGGSGFVPFRSIVTGEKCWMAYAPLSASGWALAVLFPQDELMADVFKLNRTVLFLSLAGFFVVLVVIILISRSIIRPLRLLARATEEIGYGNLDVEIPSVKSQDEVGKLALSFNYMKSSLKRYIRDLTETTAAKEKIESELRIAREIQMGILPKVFPPFPHRTQFDIYATLDPAREVGGDLYDFFFIDEDHLCFAVGDVSGKGIPAAFFMAIVMTLIRTTASQALTSDAILRQVNESLSSNNPSLMFVTLFLGILNIHSGELEYSNGGHNPPYTFGPAGEIECLESTGDVALGVVGNFSYQSRKIVLQKGQSVFVYTDGVTEAINERQEMFSEERLIEELQGLKDTTLEGVVLGLLERVKDFSRRVEQTDDITMMLLRFYGKQEG